MLSAVESFGPASGPSAAHPYAHHHHHNPYAIAAAAAAAGSAAAAAAAAVIPPTPLTPTTPTHPNSQQPLFQPQQSHLLQQHHLGYFLPPPPTTSLALITPPPTSPSSCSPASSSNSNHSNNLLPTTALIAASKCSPLQLADYGSHQQQQHQQQQQSQKQQLLHTQQQQQQQQYLLSPSRSPSNPSPHRGPLKSHQQQHQHQQHQRHQDEADAMSSAEFARPHPKQPRYSNGISSNNHSHSIPLHQRSPNAASSSKAAAKACVNNNDRHLNLNGGSVLKNGYACRTPPSKYAANGCTEQSGPVNLVTNHHNNNSGSSSSSGHLSSGIQSRLSSTPPDGSSSSSSSSVDVENDGSMSPIGISVPPRKTQAESSPLFGGSSAGVPKMPYESAAAAAAVAAAAYQFNFPHLYASRAALYGASALFPAHHAPLAPPPGALRPHPSYLTGAIGPASATHDSPSTSFSSAYMQAVQSIYNHPTIQAPQLSPPAALQHSKNMLCTPSGSMLMLAPPAPVPAGGPAASAVSNGHSALSLASPPNDLRPKSSAALPPPATAANGGTYLNGKVSAAPPDAEADTFFKVPSGKEGSLKHRILTRPSQHSIQSQLEKPETRPASMTAAVVRANNSTTNFTKGAYIELANGVLRRVEDMRTEDFIQCAERSPHHQLAESTVVKISTAPNNKVVIMFSYDKNRSKADVEVSPEHPFFVYGQGWASCNPELSHKLFALRCQRLQVGDICISLTSREPPAPVSMPKNFSKIQHAGQGGSPSSDLYAPDKRALADNYAMQPQNLSRKLHATLQESSAPNTAALTSRLSYTSLPSMPALHLMPPHLPTHHPSYAADMADLAAAAYAESAQISRGGAVPPQVGALPQNHLSPGSFYPAQLHQHNLQQQLHHHHQQQQQQQQHIFHATSPRLAPVHLTRPPSNHNPQPYNESPPSSTDGDPRSNHSGSSNGGGGGGGGCEEEQDQPMDASMSRKRRWSAPESICDEDDIEPPSKQAHQMVSVGGGGGGGGASEVASLSGYKAFITTSVAQPTP